MAAGAMGVSEAAGTAAAAPCGRRFRLLPSLHTVLFQGCGRQRGGGGGGGGPSTGEQSTAAGTTPPPRPP